MRGASGEPRVSGVAVWGCLLYTSVVVNERCKRMQVRGTDLVVEVCKLWEVADGYGGEMNVPLG